jgi:hypothetical protein
MPDGRLAMQEQLYSSLVARACENRDGDVATNHRRSVAAILSGLAGGCAAAG